MKQDVEKQGGRYNRRNTVNRGFRTLKQITHTYFKGALLLQTVLAVVAEAGGSTRTCGIYKLRVGCKSGKRLQIKLTILLFLPCLKGPTIPIARNGVVWAAVARKRGVIFHV